MSEDLDWLNNPGNVEEMDRREKMFKELKERSGKRHNTDFNENNNGCWDNDIVRGVRFMIMGGLLVLNVFFFEFLFEDYFSDLFIFGSSVIVYSIVVIIIGTNSYEIKCWFKDLFSKK